MRIASGRQESFLEISIEHGIIGCQNHRTILESVNNGFFIRKEGKVFRPISFEALNSQEDYLEIAIKMQGNITIILEINSLYNHYEIIWRSKEKVEFGFEYDLEKSGKWYGLGELEYQVWPLNKENNEIRIDKFMTKDPYNILLTPCWITSTGMGLIYPMYADMSLNMNHRGDGCFHLEINNVCQVKQIIVLADTAQACFLNCINYLSRPVRIPPKELFVNAIWTSWVNFKVDVSQEKILTFAKEIKEQGYPYSVLEIDDRWQKAYGDTEFDPFKFPAPKKMVDELHSMGFKVTLWVMPFVNCDSIHFIEGNKKGYFLKREPETFTESFAGKLPSTVILKWWQGEGAVVDFTNDDATAWFINNLKKLQDEYGIDGFKFDAGEAGFIPNTINKKQAFETEYTDCYVKAITENFNYMETRVGWLVQDKGAFVRQYDKFSKWGIDNGLHSALTQALTMGVIGYPFVLPDMVGGNQYGNMCDKELFIRWIQLNALLPSIQLSIVPWKFDEETNCISRIYVELHKLLGDYIYSAARDYTKGGLPIVSPLFLKYPEENATYEIDDQFLLGNYILVAPILIPSTLSRHVYLPEGNWINLWTSEVISGPTTITVPAPLYEIPMFINSESCNDKEWRELSNEITKLIQVLK